MNEEILKNTGCLQELQWKYYRCKIIVNWTKQVGTQMQEASLETTNVRGLHEVAQYGNWSSHVGSQFMKVVIINCCRSKSLACMRFYVCFGRWRLFGHGRGRFFNIGGFSNVAETVRLRMGRMPYNRMTVFRAGPAVQETKIKAYLTKYMLQ